MGPPVLSPIKKTIGNVQLNPLPKWIAAERAPGEEIEPKSNLDTSLTQYPWFIKSLPDNVYLVEIKVCLPCVSARTERYNHDLENAEDTEDDTEDILFHSFSSCSPRYSKVYSHRITDELHVADVSRASL